MREKPAARMGSRHSRMPLRKKQPVDSPTGQLSTEVPPVEAAGEAAEVPAALEAGAIALLAGRLAVAVHEIVQPRREEAGEEADVELGAQPGVEEVEAGDP